MKADAPRRLATDVGRPSVLLLSTSLTIGGAERLVLDMASAYVALGVPTIVVSLTNGREMLDQVGARGVDIRFLGMRKSPAGLMAATRTLSQLIRAEGIEIVHASTLVK